MYVYLRPIQVHLAKAVTHGNLGQSGLKGRFHHFLYPPLQSALLSSTLDSLGNPSVSGNFSLQSARSVRTRSCHAIANGSCHEIAYAIPTFLPKEKCFSLEGKGRTTRKVSRNSAFLLLSLNYPIYFCIWPQLLSFFRASRLVGGWSELDFHIKRKPHSTPREITFERWWQMCSSNK